MALRPHQSPMRPLLHWPAFGSSATIALALVLFVVVSALRVSDPNAVHAYEVLFVLPITLLALRFGLRGGLLGALLGLALVVATDYNDQDLTTLSATSYLSWAAAFLLLGTLLGVFVDHRRRLEAEIRRNFDESLDLLG